MTSFGCEYKRPSGMCVMWASPMLLVPYLLPFRCGVEAEVKQSRHPKIAGRAFYVCKWTFDPMPAAPCDFFQWIDEPGKYDPRIRLFPYHNTELKPYHQFRRWVPPPPNPPRMTEEEKQEAACRRVRDPPMCKCGVPAKLMHSNLGVAPKFTPFFRCSLKTHAMWPTEEQVREFESGKAPWPCVSSPSCKCKCGILATEAVVPSKLGYGLFCGNAYGDYWVRIRKRRIEMEELQEKAEEAQMETMKALVTDLPVGKVNVDKKGKGVVIAVDDDDDDDDELLCEGDSD
ncbi:hypothetical protein SETIT_9G246400v2 [Setaria italica]|uniref:Zinc finger GRF-type domain-containing protein n=1 Tax=Setaria italica TaxID=4555 RepID=A0A368SKB0_SETIT|nr:hypothetical protein SETIT_9G246400v2 [Setaria italica]